MYENQTQEAIQARVLARISDEIDKREGSLIQTAVGPACAELAQMYIALDGIISESFADTQTREYLIRRAAERGVIPLPAAAAVVKGVFNLSDIQIGQRFACGQFNYVTTQKIDDCEYRLTCETTGSAPNGTTGTLLPLTTVSGLTSAQITEILIPGTDEESTEALRERYFSSFSAKAFGGNRADYIEKTLGIPGVGAVKVYRASSISGDSGTSGGNVRLVILDSGYSVPSSTVVSLVKETLDPEDYTGEGYGLAPLWHHVHVEAATLTTVDMDIAFTFDTGYSFSDLENGINAAIDTYFDTLARSWSSDTSGLIVRRAYIQAALIQITGILDAEVETLNDADDNLTLDPDAIPGRGTITCS